MTVRVNYGPSDRPRRSRSRLLAEDEFAQLRAGLQRGLSVEEATTYPAVVPEGDPLHCDLCAKRAGNA